MKNGAAIAFAIALSISLSACDREAPTFELLSVPDAGFADTGAPDLGVSFPDAGPIETRRADGLPCEVDDDCSGGVCIRGPDFQDGYCSSRCRNDDDCTRPDGECVDEFGLRFCARTCFGGSICRAGYECRSGPRGSEVCLPPLPPPPGDGADGAECARDSDCFGGRCFRDPEWPGGYCTTPDCFDSTLCHPGDHGAHCGHPTAPGGTDYACLQTCASPADCRPGYACAAIDLSLRGCIPDIAAPPDLDPPDSYPFEVKCGATPLGRQRFSLQFDIPMGATSYMVTPFARDGRYLVPIGIDLPTGGRIDFLGANRFQALTPIFRPWIAPTLIPTVSQHAGQLESGSHTFVVESSSNDLCWQMISENGDGTEIDLRIYLVGLDGIDASNAPMNPDFQAMLARSAELFAQVGLTLSDVAYVDVSDADAARYSMVLEEEHVGEIVALSQRTNGDLDSELVLDLFFVQTIAFGGGGILGIASALPGPAGLHGTQASGVISTAEFIGLTEPGPNGEPQDGNSFTALVLVHELGHFLGLLHTSEIAAPDRSFDPVLDTPECAIDVPIDQCPDLGNVMFPFADPGNVYLSPGQGYTMKKNPLSKEPP
jgi:hypothetical protein